MMESLNYQDSLATFYVDINDRVALSWDLEYQWDKGRQFEAGLQWIYRNIEQDYLAQFAANQAGDLVLEDSLDNQFFYKDNIAAIYGVYGKEGKNWQYEIGLRAEQLFNDYRVKNTAEKFDNQIFSLFPSLKIGFSPDERQTIQLSYNRRINRPAPNRLNPFPDFAQPYRLQLGNPELKPEFINSFDLGYSHQWNTISWFSSLFYNQYQDLIQRITELRPDGTTLLSPINIDRLHNYGWNNNLNYRGDKLNMQLSLIYFVNQFDSPEVDNDGDGYQIKWVADWEMINDLEWQVLANYFGPTEVSQGYQKSYFFCDLGLKWTFAKRKAALSVQLSDVFDSLREASVIDVENLFRESVDKIDTRRIRLGLNWKF